MMDDDAETTMQTPDISSYPPPGPNDKCLDLCFVLDCTGSMGSYIASATQNIETIVNEITNSEKLTSPACLRLSLVAYRDHPPQDNSYVTRVTEFTSDVTVIKSALKALYASGGGDGPEAVTAALSDAYKLDWREFATKMVVLIADAPPHGIGEYGDGFAEGSPDGNDPLQLVRAMNARGIVLFMVACEPALSGYTYSTDFFRGLCQISSGALVPLTNAGYLAHVIVGSALEQMDMERLITEVGQAVAERLQSGEHSVEDVARDLHASLSLRNVSTKHLIVENIYADTPDTLHNINVWVNAANIREARPQLKKITVSRFTEEYNARRHSSGYRSSLYRPFIPSRTAETPAVTSPSPPASPPRKVVADFKPFTAPSAMSMSATTFGGGPKEHSSPPPTFGTSLAAFGLRSPNSSKPRPEVENSGESESMDGVELKLAGISLEQAKKITMQTAWRARA